VCCHATCAATRRKPSARTPPVPTHSHRSPLLVGVRQVRLGVHQLDLVGGHASEDRRRVARCELPHLLHHWQKGHLQCKYGQLPAGGHPRGHVLQPRRHAPAPCATRTSRPPSSGLRRHRSGVTAAGGRRRTAAAPAGTASPPSPQRARAPGMPSLAAVTAGCEGWFVVWASDLECGSALQGNRNLRPPRTDSCSSLKWPTVPGASESHSGVPDSLAAIALVGARGRSGCGRASATGDVANNKQRAYSARC